jgi:hypothetical protein
MKDGLQVHALLEDNRISQCTPNSLALAYVASASASAAACANPIIGKMAAVAGAIFKLISSYIVFINYGCSPHICTYSNIRIRILQSHVDLSGVILCRCPISEAS